ncbi:MAG TPA: hypothetical protein VJU81_21710 [Methylomirabilota bacterium]|nr:hypothetical protein [Methylomirabilota bacterium]
MRDTLNGERTGTMQVRGRWDVVAWALGALLLAGAIFSIMDHVWLFAEAMSRAPRPGPVPEWPF